MGKTIQELSRGRRDGRTANHGSGVRVRRVRRVRVREDKESERGRGAAEEAQQQMDAGERH